MLKEKTVNIYFSYQGYAIVNTDNKSLSLRVAKATPDTPEEKERLTWFYLGNALKEALDDKYEFVNLFSDTKVIDQLQGALIEDEDSLMMHRSITKKGIPQFVWVEYNKMTQQSMKAVFSKVRSELASTINGPATK